MAFLGDLGKFFRISTPEAAQIGASFATGGIGSGIASTIKAVATPIEDSASRPADVSAPPAGVDSPATLAGISQTSQIAPMMLDGMSRGGFMMQQPMQAGFGLAGPVTQLFKQGSRQLGKGTGTGIGIGLGAGSLVDNVVDIFGNEKKLIITRKLQRDVKKVFMLSGGNIAFVSANSMRLFKKSLSEDQIIDILFKTFKNQGPYVTKAAVRKTRATIRKMETLCDLKDRLCPPKRRAPARRRTMSAQTITQVK